MHLSNDLECLVEVGSQGVEDIKLQEQIAMSVRAQADGHSRIAPAGQQSSHAASITRGRAQSSTPEIGI